MKLPVRAKTAIKEKFLPTPSGNRTRVSPVAGEYSTTRPTVCGAVMHAQFDDADPASRGFCLVGVVCKCCAEPRTPTFLTFFMIFVLIQRGGTCLQKETGPDLRASERAPERAPDER
jgi:hypothetical protein